ncbi:hypothetical protein FHR81_001492 [Actinoalloteichus hoggarensis]|uniref:Uncharacterized protein n=1 Tax=Actinoalloteichus hoggarensis TaxID=1470176 RepID=A0A221W0C0_9PSEU|nr:hypothetical protein AHOG_07900 [Actinoalloteichus hoggarensis]MBB5920462.1 hypothetical protein [Actinoalloteichus hoggarensis]
MLPRVVAAEEQLATRGEDGANLGCRPAAVAAVCSGELGAGERSCHVASPSVPGRGFRRRRACRVHRGLVVDEPWCSLPPTLTDARRLVSVPARRGEPDHVLTPGCSSRHFPDGLAPVRFITVSDLIVTLGRFVVPGGVLIPDSRSRPAGQNRLQPAPADPRSDADGRGVRSPITGPPAARGALLLIAALRTAAFMGCLAYGGTRLATLGLQRGVHGADERSPQCSSTKSQTSAAPWTRCDRIRRPPVGRRVRRPGGHPRNGACDVGGACCEQPFDGGGQDLGAHDPGSHRVDPPSRRRRGEAGPP